MAGQAKGWYEQVQESQRNRDQAILEQQQIINEGYKNQQDKVNLQQQRVEDQASSLYNPNNPQSLDQIAQYLGEHHDSRGQMAAINASSIAKSNAITAQLNSLKIHSAQMEEAGPILSSITDQNSYDRGMKQLSDIGLNLKQLGITGDPLVDIPNMPRLTLSTISLKERATMENQKLQRLAQQERMKTEEMRANQQADYQNARLAQFDNAQ
ncbi:MAG: hypothetical protein ACREQ5_23015, partial [Candidatus Dormibacteria bacterium]